MKKATDFNGYVETRNTSDNVKYSFTFNIHYHEANKINNKALKKFPNENDWRKRYAYIMKKAAQEFLNQ